MTLIEFMKLERAVYLEDDCYAAFDKKNFQVLLGKSDGVQMTSVVPLTTEALANLLAWILPPGTRVSPPPRDRPSFRRS